MVERAVRKQEVDGVDPDFWPWLAQASILIVDDEPGMRNFLVRTLKPRCKLIEEASDTREASRKLDEQPFDVVILDNLKAHASQKAAASLKERGAWFLFLPAYSPDLNPIEMAFSKLKAHLRTAGARTYEALWRAVGDICSLFEPRECWSFLRHAGYASD